MEVLIIILAIIFIVEIFTRLYFSSKKQLTFDLTNYPFYTYKKSTQGRSPWYLNQIGNKSTPIITISELGVRGNFDKNKNNILCLGCSFTEGAGLKDDETYPGLLEKYIGDENINVINAGVGGYGIFQIENLFRRLVANKPKIVIVQLLDYYRFPLDQNKLKDSGAFFRFQAILKKISIILWFISKVIFKNIGNAGSPVNPYFIHSLNIDKEDIWKMNLKYLDEIKNICQKENIKLVIFQWPGVPFFCNKVKEYCDINKIYNCDAREIYSFYEENELRLHKYDRHPNSLANSLIAKVAYRCLSVNNLID